MLPLHNQDDLFLLLESTFELFPVLLGVTMFSRNCYLFLSFPHPLAISHQILLIVSSDYFGNPSSLLYTHCYCAFLVWVTVTSQSVGLFVFSTCLSNPASLVVHCDHLPQFWSIEWKKECHVPFLLSIVKVRQYVLLHLFLFPDK